MKYFFIVGCPRSGTTWLQTLLGQHPAVATTRETHLFNAYLAGLQEVWQNELKSSDGVGLHPVLTEEEFYSLCADFAQAVMDTIAKINAGARVVVEKTPNHVRHVPLILKLFPDAHFIHLIRDPRAAVASLCAAGHSWGRGWASTSPARNARRWVSDVSAGRAIASLTDQHVTVKYEALLEPTGWQVLQDLLNRMGLEADNDFCQQAAAECTLDRLRKKSKDRQSLGNTGAPPADFFRKGKADSWADELSARDVEVVEYIAGDLMRDCGYTTSTRFADHHRKPWRLTLHDLADSLEWRANRIVAFAFRKARRLE